jgi:transketolase
MNNFTMVKAADNIRILAASMVEKAKSGHPGGAMGGADFINTLYAEFLVYDPQNPLIEGAELLKAEGIKTRIVSVPSEGVFRNQDKKDQESVLPAGKKVFGLTACLPVTLEGLVGSNGKVWGLNSFGFSAPYKILDEKLGFTAANVCKQVKEFLGK